MSTITVLLQKKWVWISLYSRTTWHTHGTFTSNRVQALGKLRNRVGKATTFLQYDKILYVEISTWKNTCLRKCFFNYQETYMMHTPTYSFLHSLNISFANVILFLYYYLHELEHGTQGCYRNCDCTDFYHCPQTLAVVDSNPDAYTYYIFDHCTTYCRHCGYCYSMVGRFVMIIILWNR